MNIIITALFPTLLTISTVTAKCGYSACHKTDPNKLNIHLIPHSHDDVGYINLIDTYYGFFEIVITNVIKSLRLSPNRKFTQVEIYYFHRWWTQQNNTVKRVVRKLVSNGQLVFSNGGWTGHDECATNYNNIIDQLTLGLKFLNEQFGECGHPKVSWQIDSFGASKEMASLYALMGYDGHVVYRGIRPNGEFIWIGSKDLNTTIFTTVLHDFYSPPNGFDFEFGNDITSENRENKTNIFISVAKKWNNDYNNINQVLMPMGSDFRYKNSENWYSNIDILIEEIKENHKDIDAFYSTPQCYIQEVKRMKKNFLIRDVDYVNYWVGYFSNRPTLKKLDRVANNYLQVSKQLDVLSRLNPITTRAYLDESRNELAILTHHDAITGTSPQPVIDDYIERLYNSVISSSAVIRFAYKQLISKYNKQIFCTNLDISECSITESEDRIAVTIYNPIARPYSKYIRVPVGSDDYEVYDNNGLRVMNKILAPIHESIASIPERNSKATHELVFRVNLPTLGFVTYFIRKIHSLKKPSMSDEMDKNETPLEMNGKSFSLKINEKTGEIMSITMNGITQFLKQSFKWYKSMAGKEDKEDSGVYQFCPHGRARNFDEPKLLSKFSSDSYHEIHQKFGEYISQTVRTYEDEDYIEFDWSVGPIPIDDDIGKEIVIRFDSSLKSEKKFFTDANGRQMIERTIKNYTFKCAEYNVRIQPTGNYYPISGITFIRDNIQGIQMSILNDRTQGGGSLKEGSLELMIQRRLTKSGPRREFVIDEMGVDGRGIVVRGKHYLLFKPINESAKYVKDLSRRLLLEPIISFAKYDSSETDYSSKHLTLFSGLNNPLPENIHLLTLENWKNNQILIRLENIYENSDNILDNSPLTKGLDLNIKELFKTFKVSDIVETNLVANQLLSESKRFQWNSKKSLRTELINNEIINGSVIHLLPQQIRTFILTVEVNVLPLNKCSFKWIKASTDTIPTDSLIVGYYSDKTPFYVCKISLNKDLNIGKANSKDGCRFNLETEEIGNKTFEILVAENVEWIPRHGTDPLPETSLLSGHKLNGQPIYIGRCAMTDRNSETHVIGKIDNYYFNSTTSDSNNNNCINHEVLVCNMFLN